MKQYVKALRECDQQHDIADGTRMTAKIHSAIRKGYRWGNMIPVEIFARPDEMFLGKLERLDHRTVNHMLGLVLVGSMSASEHRFTTSTRYSSSYQSFHRNHSRLINDEGMRIIQMTTP